MASGDLTYEEQTNVITLDTAQKSAAATFLNTIWNGGVANVLGFSVWRDNDNPSTIYAAVRGKRKVPTATLPMGVKVLEREP